METKRKEELVARLKGGLLEKINAAVRGMLGYEAGLVAEATRDEYGLWTVFLEESAGAATARQLRATPLLRHMFHGGMLRGVARLTEDGGVICRVSVLFSCSHTYERGGIDVLGFYFNVADELVDVTESINA